MPAKHGPNKYMLRKQQHSKFITTLVFVGCIIPDRSFPTNFNSIDINVYLNLYIKLTVTVITFANVFSSF